MSLVAGTRLGPYEIQSAIGAGGMGEVYKARDTRLGRDVAVKVLPGDLASDPDRRRRFEQEARAVAALSHANIVALYDVGTHDGAPFLVSELLEGETLTDALARRGALDRQGRRGWAPDCEGPRGRPRPGHRPPRPEAVQRVPDARRPGEAAGLRDREAGGSAGRARRGRADRDRAGRHRGGHAPGHGGLHGARAGARPALRPPGRHLRVRLRALRDAVGAAGLPGRHPRRHDVGDPQGGPAAAHRPAPIRLASPPADRGPLPREAGGRSLLVGARPRLGPRGSGDRVRAGPPGVGRARYRRSPAGTGD